MFMWREAGSPIRLRQPTEYNVYPDVHEKMTLNYHDRNQGTHNGCRLAGSS